MNKSVFVLVVALFTLYGCGDEASVEELKLPPGPLPIVNPNVNGVATPQTQVANVGTEVIPEDGATTQPLQPAASNETSQGMTQNPEAGSAQAGDVNVQSDTANTGSTGNPDQQGEAVRKPKAKVVNVKSNDTLNVREGVGVSHPVIEKLKPGSEVSLLDATKKAANKQVWQKIETQSGKTGWV